jgi:hypothetical protein
MPAIVHPPINVIVNEIIRDTNARLIIPFGEVWSGPFKYGAGGQNQQHYQISELRLCLKFMTDNNLIDHIDSYDEKTADWNNRIELSKFGIEIRESGGWLKHLEKNTELTRLTTELTSLQIANEKTVSSRFRITVALSILSIALLVGDVVLANKTRALESELADKQSDIESFSKELASRDSLLETKNKQIEKLEKIDHKE